MRAASLPSPTDYGRDTTLDITTSWPVAYSLTGKAGKFTVTAPDGTVLFQIDTDHADFNISSQDLVLAALPSSVSDHDGSTTFTSAVANYSRVDFTIEVGPSGWTYPDYRVQGDLRIRDAQGLFD